MKNLKNQKGITLVALVITIIVLLILAGVSLSLVVGEGGILRRASNSSAVQKAAATREQVELDIADLASEYYTEKYVNNNDNLKIGDKIVDNVGAYVYYKSTKDSNFGKLSNGSYTISTSSANYDDNATYTITMTVPNANGNSDLTGLTGTLNADGSWKNVITLPSVGS